jgi:biopolymer transport protein ExbD
MALSLQGSDDSDESWMAEINTTPLVDVMLVLLIIFLLTIPVVSASVQLQLPVQTARNQDTTGDYVIVSIDAAGRLFLNDSPVETLQTLSQALAPAMARNPRPQIHLRADGAAPYAAVGPVIDIAQGFGMSQVSLLTEQAPPAPAQRSAQGRVGESAR